MVDRGKLNYTIIILKKGLYIQKRMGKTHIQKQLERLDPSRRNIVFEPSQTFQYDKSGDSPEFLKYLERLKVGENSFGCPHSIILEEDIRVHREGAPPDRYITGDVLCNLLIGTGVSRRCGTNSTIISREDGNYLIQCRKGSYKIAFKPESVEPISS